MLLYRLLDRGVFQIESLAEQLQPQIFLALGQVGKSPQGRL